MRQAKIPGTFEARGALCAILVSLLFVAGCHHPVMGRPAIVGASASSGVGAEIPSPDPEDSSDTISVDLEASYDTVVLASHRRPLNFSSGFHFRDPTESTRRQLQRAMDTDPSCLIAIDLLFWSAHLPVDEDALGTEEESRRRHASLEEVLGQLEAIEIPMVLGYIPPIDPDLIEFVDIDRVPSRELLDDLNARVEQWAAEHPNVVLVDFGRFIDSVYAEDAATIAGNRFDGAQMRGLMNEDNLHPTAKGLVVLMQIACAELEARGLIGPEDWQSRTDLAMKALPGKAEIVASRDFGFFGLLELERAQKRFDAAIEDGDCDEAFRIIDNMLEQFASLSEEPEFWSSIEFAYFLRMIRGDCGERMAEAQFRQIDRLTPEMAMPRPNSWKFTLWQDAQEKLGRDDLVIERLARIRRDCDGYPEPYAKMALAYLRNENAWKKHRDLVADLFPREEWLPRLDEYCRGRYDLDWKYDADEPFDMPISGRSFRTRTNAWEFLRNPRIQAGMPVAPKPTRDDTEWRPKAKNAARYLDVQVGIALTLAEHGEIEVARSLVDMARDRVGDRFYIEWQRQTELPQHLRHYPGYAADSKGAPTLDELDTWDPRAERTAVVEEIE